MCINTEVFRLPKLYIRGSLKIVSSTDARSPSSQEQCPVNSLASPLNAGTISAEVDWKHSD